MTPLTRPQTQLLARLRLGWHLTVHRGVPCVYAHYGDPREYCERAARQLVAKGYLTAEYELTDLGRAASVGVPAKAQG